MEQLPDEILLLIFSHLLSFGQKEIKAVRVVCKKFESFANPYLTIKCIAGVEPETLLRLEEISQNEKFRNRITTVVYSVTPLHDWPSFDEYLKIISKSHNVTPHVRIQCLKSWYRYRQVCSDIVKNRETAWDNVRDRISTALAKMLNVKCLELVDDMWETPIHPLYKDLSGEYCIVRYQALGRSTEFSRGLEMMASALATIERQLVYLSDDTRAGLGSTHCFTGKARELFTTLRKIRLSFDDASFIRQKDEARRTWQVDVSSSLSLAQHLEYLDLRVCIDELSTGPFSGIFDNNTWPILSHLHLHLELYYQSFSAFCQRHRKSLCSLQLANCYLYDGTWEILLEEMRHLKLTSAKLEYLSEGDGLVWISTRLQTHLPEAEEYLLHGGENPLSNGTVTLRRIKDGEDG